MLIYKRIKSWLVLIVLTASLVVGCGLAANHHDSGDDSAGDAATQSQTSDCRVIDHDVGETEVCGEPQKVVTLSLHMLDLLLSLDRQPAASTMTLNLHRGDIFDNPARQIPYLGDRLTTQPVNLGNDHTPSLEKLSALKPDLIIGEAGRNAGQYDLLSQIAPTLLWQDRTDKGKWQVSLRDLATALGQGEKAETVIQQVETRIADARADFADVVATHPNLLLLGANTLDEGFLVVEPDSYLGELLSGIGFQLIPPPPATLDAANPLMSIEALPTLNDADTIIVLGWNADVSEELENFDSSTDESATQQVEVHQGQAIQQSWQANDIAQSLTASQENRVYFTTFYKWNGLNGPMGAELIVEELRQFLG
ncbi:MAG: ABC transporter substrate-binding protein [Leptolyngbya sp. SIO1E4]|nr:ABC transporter substrate-binding protein [Leptolyngbya sp. SIO1E4]